MQAVLLDISQKSALLANNNESKEVVWPRRIQTVTVVALAFHSSPQEYLNALLLTQAFSITPVVAVIEFMHLLANSSLTVTNIFFHIPNKTNLHSIKYSNVNEVGGFQYFLNLFENIESISKDAIRSVTISALSEYSQST